MATGPCATAVCYAPAARLVKWRDLWGHERRGLFCEDCARKLWLHDDAVTSVSPAFPLAAIIPFRSVGIRATRKRPRQTAGRA